MLQVFNIGCIESLNNSTYHPHVMKSGMFTFITATAPLPSLLSGALTRMTFGNCFLLVMSASDEASGNIGTFQLYTAWAITMHAEKNMP